MTVRVSVYSSTREWWLQRRTEPTVRDDFPRHDHFSSASVTLLIDTSGRVSGIAKGGKKGSASDYSSNIVFDQIHRIAPIDVHDLSNRIRARARTTARATFEEGFGVLTEAASGDVRQILRDQYPAASEALESIVTLEPNWMLLDSESAVQYRMERDAVNLLLEIAGFDRGEALSAVRTPSTAGHFALGDVFPNEDSLVIDDLSVFPGWDQVATLRPAGRVFEDPHLGRRLTVLHANKNRVELTSGVDLLYYIHEYQSFVLVQYKVVRRETSGLVVRITNQLRKEVKRMKTLESQFKRMTSPANLMDHRLSNSICFLKFCDADQPAMVTDLSRGRYIDLEGWRFINRDRVTTGRRGGKLLRWEDLDRYMTNSLFAELASEGWIGSSVENSDDLVDYLFESYDAGRSLLLGSLHLGRSLRRDSRTRGALRTFEVALP